MKISDKIEKLKQQYEYRHRIDKIRLLWESYYQLDYNPHIQAVLRPEKQPNLNELEELTKTILLNSDESELAIFITDPNKDIRRIAATIASEIKRLEEQ